PRPLADRMRPRTLEEFAGQQHLLAPSKPLRTQLERDELSSVIFWGPPGSGKTTLARIIAARTKSDFVNFSAVLSGIKEIKAVMEEASRTRRYGRRTILFVDEIHRFNKAQQDAFLPYVERGYIVQIGATTENPSFEIISALLSRARVYRLQPLAVEDILLLLRRALADQERGYGNRNIAVDDSLLRQIAVFSSGDARIAYNVLEALVQGAISEPQPSGSGGPSLAPVAHAPGSDVLRITPALLEATLQSKAFLYDKSGEEHFNLISALHKSLRNSDADAAIYWLARMLESGEDPLYVARRIVRFASEDIGLADPQALPLAVAAMQAVDLIGMPEGALALAEAAIYLALAPKSNSLYSAYSAAQQDLVTTTNEPVPLHLRNAPTPLMKAEGYGAGYEYAHELAEKVSAMPCLPPGLEGRRYYQPAGEGLEQAFRKQLEEIRERKRKAGRK
ncbi:MAG: replication-associated recombination protein A, partial [Terriglobia bacterium]